MAVPNRSTDRTAGVPEALVDFHTGRHAHGLAVQQLREEDAERDPVGHVRQRARSIQVGDARGVGDLLGRPRAHADVATWRGPGRLRPRPGFGRRRRRGCAVVRVPVRTPTLSRRRRRDDAARYGVGVGAGRAVAGGAGVSVGVAALGCGGRVPTAAGAAFGASPSAGSCCSCVASCCIVFLRG